MVAYPKNKAETGGIGNKCEDLPYLGAFCAMTGGSIEQRRHLRNYSKVAHAEDNTPSPFPPVEDVSGLRRVF